MSRSTASACCHAFPGFFARWRCCLSAIGLYRVIVVHGAPAGDMNSASLALGAERRSILWMWLRDFLLLVWRRMASLCSGDSV